MLIGKPKEELSIWAYILWSVWLLIVCFTQDTCIHIKYIYTTLETFSGNCLLSISGPEAFSAVWVSATLWLFFRAVTPFYAVLIGFWFHSGLFPGEQRVLTGLAIWWVYLGLLLHIIFHLDIFMANLPDYSGAPENFIVELEKSIETYRSQFKDLWVLLTVYSCVLMLFFEGILNFNFFTVALGQRFTWFCRFTGPMLRYYTFGGESFNITIGFILGVSCAIEVTIFVLRLVLCIYQWRDPKFVDIQNLLFNYLTKKKQKLKLKLKQFLDIWRILFFS